LVENSQITANSTFSFNSQCTTSINESIVADYLANKAMDLRASGLLSATQLQQELYQEMVRHDSQFETTQQRSYQHIGSVDYSYS
jgi:hypothetical protein